MVLCREWCCFRDLRHVAIAAGMFSLCTSFSQIIAEIVFWWEDLGKKDLWLEIKKFEVSNATTTEHAIDSTVTMATYIVMMILDGLMLIFALILLVGVSKWKFIGKVRGFVRDSGQQINARVTYRSGVVSGCGHAWWQANPQLFLQLMAPGGRCLVLLWIVYLPLYLAYEIGFNIYQYILLSQKHGAEDVFSTPIVLMLIYWGLKFIFYVALLIGVISYSQLLKEHMFRGPQVPVSEQPSYRGGSEPNHGEQDKPVYKVVQGPPNYRTHDTRQPVAYAVYPGPKAYRAY